MKVKITGPVKIRHTVLPSCCFSSSEIPQFRLPYDVVSFEVELMKDLGVKVSTLSTAFIVFKKLFNKTMRFYNVKLIIYKKTC